ncbi:winged helix-turn-helix domain-containing protein [Candidatus Micrarchaeota archaeon]|nr:winged helix-turn-helix domain-containing protein [Candidatus Micrarchaeota archaeon]
MDEDKIVLDRKSFEALAVDTRVRILKSLKVRRKTLSEISKEQGMSVSGVKEHLETLEGVGLIEKKDDGHKWKYYELTKKGSDIVAPRELRVWILLSISTIALVASMIALFSPPAMMAGQALAPEATDGGPQLMAGAYPAVADSESGERPPEGASRNLAEGGETTLGAAATSADGTDGGAEQKEAAATQDLTMPLAVGAISMVTLVGCVGILAYNRMRQPAP